MSSTVYAIHINWSSNAVYHSHYGMGVNWSNNAEYHMLYVLMATLFYKSQHTKQLK